jgi:hypothetical protein
MMSGMRNLQQVASYRSRHQFLNACARPRFGFTKGTEIDLGPGYRNVPIGALSVRKLLI